VRCSINCDAPDWRAVLAIGAVAFRPVVTLNDTGEVHGLKSFEALESPDLFSQLLTNPNAFASFLKDHCHDIYSAMFVFQIQPVFPQYPCSIVHVLPAVNGKDTDAIIAKLFE
jgi:hypothetical protein